MSPDLTDKIIACYDIETPFIPKEGIHALNTIYCIGIVILKNKEIISKKLYTNVWKPYSDGSLLEGIKELNKADIRAAFNNLGFDDIVIRNILGVDFTPMEPYYSFNSLDLMLVSKLQYSKDDLISIDAQLALDTSLWGSFSLRAFGERLGFSKLHFDEFDTGLTSEMAKYCIIDCEVTAKLFLHLTEQENYPLTDVIELETKAKTIIMFQEHLGFYLDIELTEKLNTELLTEKLDLFNQLEGMFSPKWLRDGQVKKYKKQSKVRKYLPNSKYVPLLGTK